MRNTVQLFTTSIVVIFFISCKLDKTRNEKFNHLTDTGFVFHFQPNYDLIIPEPIIHPVSFSGVWQYGFPFYSSELTISENGTFSFNETGCTGKSYSKGTWLGGVDRIMLTSYKEYAFHKPQIKNFAHEWNFTGQKRKRRSRLNYVTIDTSLFFHPDLTSVKLYSSDSSNRYFDHLQLVLKGDTLYQLDRSGFTTDVKYVQYKR